MLPVTQRRRIPFGATDLKLLVEVAGEALKTEDSYLLDCTTAPRWQDTPLGIRENPNERYYQFVIWRQLRRSFPWQSETERYGHDFAFFIAGTEKPVAFAEIKLWWTDLGKSELRGIRRDIEKLELRSVPAVMLIITWNYKNESERNLKVLANHLNLSRDDLVTHSFDTVPWPGEGKTSATEIMTIGFFVSQKWLEPGLEPAKVCPT